ncbi:MAG: energy transducer TonB [Betaproteobacteria bacterium]|nr:energy transducer TonB [Betaproteobacteria bacterium]
MLASVAASLVLHVLALSLFPDWQLDAPSNGGSRILTAKLTPRIETPGTLPGKPGASVPEQRDIGREIAAMRPTREAPRPALAAPSPAPSSASSPQRKPETPASAAPAAALEAEPPGAPGILAAPAERGAPMGSPGILEAQGPGASKPPLAVPQARESQGSGGVPGRAAARRTGDTDAITLDQYRLALIGVAKRYKRYPARAMEMGWQGRVEVRLVVGASGLTQTASIKSSSGYEVLDQQALEIVLRAKPLTPVPASLRGREFTIDIPIIFELETG